MRLLAWFVLILVLQACSSHRPLPADVSLDNREQALLAVTDWRLEGKLGFRAPAESGSAYLTWGQAAEHFSIRVQGPLGQGSAAIDGAPGNVMLSHEGEEFRGENAEQLLAQQLGWQLPVSDLRYWVRALPAPDRAARANIERDERGLLLRQSQDDWVLEYGQYQWVQGHALPGRIKAQSASRGVRLNLVIKQWQLEL